MTALVTVVCTGLLACGGSLTEPTATRDLTGQWRGFAKIPTWALETPLEMTLADDDGVVTGTGGGVDCRYFATCGSFYSYVVSGSHDATTVQLEGRTPEGRTWTLRGRIDPSGQSISGVISGQDFPVSSCQMSKPR